MTANDPQTVPIERFPDPVCSYVYEGDTAVVTDHNDQFGDMSELSTGDPLAGLFENLRVVGETISLNEADQCWVRDPDHERRCRYLVRSLPPEDGVPGTLILTAVSEDDPEDVGVDRVASVISHDLRNPLDVARARLRAGRELEAEEHFEHVEQAHDRMERIIQDVLTLARGSDVVNPEDQVDLGDAVRDAWRMVETNGASLDIADDLPTATADRDRVTRLFENLFRNAVEHGVRNPGRVPQDAGNEASEDGGEHDSTSAGHGVTITVERLPGGLAVADDGVGIAADDRERVFEPGFTSEDHGTGLGLAIVARIADLHGWSVEVTDSDAGGARFEITGVKA